MDKGGFGGDNNGMTWGGNGDFDLGNMGGGHGVDHVYQSIPGGGHGADSVKPHLYTFMRYAFK